MDHLPIADISTSVLPGGLRLTVGHVLVGPGNHGGVYRLTGISSRHTNLTRVFLMPRDAANSMGAANLSDTWALRVVAVEESGVVLHIRRLDDATSWGMALRLDVMVLE